MSTFSRFRPAFLLLGISFVSFAIAILIGIRVFGKAEDAVRPIPRQSDVTLIQSWMSLPYISKVYGVPLSVFDVALGVDKKSHFESIDVIAQKKGKKTADVLAQIQSLITTFQVEHPKPHTQ